MPIERGAEVRGQLIELESLLDGRFEGRQEIADWFAKQSRYIETGKRLGVVQHAGVITGTGLRPNDGVVRIRESAPPAGAPGGCSRISL
ncbi:MAG TPA: hypothetical protein VFA33_20700 [Bryobacteraceae bacterium]|nr:hypothetical protein [Bryobacteraceae bacterium]